MRWSPIVLLLVMSGLPADSRAFSIGSGFTDPCHERMVIAAYLLTSVDVPRDRVLVPQGEAWNQISRTLIEEFKIPVRDDKERSFIHGLFLGVRSIDTDGHSSLNLSALRSLHVDPEGQYDHCLRSASDDYEQGDRDALLSCRQTILGYTDAVAHASSMPQQEQVITVDFATDFHGSIKVKAWAPAFFLGQALHVVQDSFCHTIRSDDMRQVIQLMNYSDSMSSSWRESRDGIRHSPAMDVCNGETEPVVAAALKATIDMMRATRAALGKQDRPEIEAVLDKWLTYKPGCTLDNRYCDSPWAERARRNPSRPYLSELFGCSIVAASDRRYGLTGMHLVLLLLTIIAIRRRQAAGQRNWERR